ncbi:hypothetical protein MRB53_010055 [Persea americana]|uniref:Uncharacterized protein n=1 Tax=Persea americana TaxID=3435 RepID=A0ACC2LRK0_PERAE|nr:hypothetical protein MRB53_010055 [Persea americana]
MRYVRWRMMDGESSEPGRWDGLFDGEGDGGERAMERVMVMVGERDVGEVGEFCTYSSLCLRERGRCVQVMAGR